MSAVVVKVMRDRKKAREEAEGVSSIVSANDIASESEADLASKALQSVYENDDPERKEQCCVVQ